MSDFGDKPYGLSDVKLTSSGGTQVDLPSAMRLSFSEMIQSGELRGDDKLVSVVSFHEGVEWELEAGGIDLDAYGILTGRTITDTGSTPNQTSSMSGEGGECFPYFKIYGKAIGDDCAGDVHCKLFKCKVTELSGEFAGGQFFITSCSGIAIDDDTNGSFEFVQHETAADLPAS